MGLYRIVYSLLISIVLFLAPTVSAHAQAMYPSNVGDKARYAAIIETPKAYLSGICILYHDDNGDIKGSFFNEFGISAIDFTYIAKKDKVKLHHVIKMMNKWYIRRVLRHDLREVLQQLKNGNGNYTNTKYHLTYQFTPVETSE